MVLMLLLPNRWLRRGSPELFKIRLLTNHAFKFIKTGSKADRRDYSGQGSVVAVDANTGKKLGQTYTVAENGGNPGGYSGNPVWQPPAIDPARG
jgi:hypothetical protein